MLVPRQYFSLLARHREAQLRHEYPAALVAATLLRAFGAKKVKPQDFMPSYRKPKEQEVPWEVLLSKVRAIHSSLGGQ